METAIQVVWWVGLVAALGLTLAAVKLLALVLRTLGDLRELSERIATAAEGLGRALAGPMRLDDAGASAARFRQAAGSLASAAAAVRSGLGGSAPAEGEPSDGPAGGSAAAGAGEIGGAAGGPEASS